MFTYDNSHGYHYGYLIDYFFVEDTQSSERRLETTLRTRQKPDP